MTAVYKYSISSPFFYSSLHPTEKLLLPYNHSKSVLLSNDSPQSFKMGSLLKSVFPCLPIRRAERSIQLPIETEKDQCISENAAVQKPPRDSEKSRLCNEEAATSIVSAMWDADEISPSLDATIQSLVHQAGGWSDYLAHKIVASLEPVLKAGKPKNAAMREAYDKGCEAAKEIKGFAADHPMATAVFCTVIALGVLEVLAPYVVEWLAIWVGFGESGPIEGTGAAWWQSTYGGLVPKGSLFSYLQRLGMTLKRV